MTGQQRRVPRKRLALLTAMFCIAPLLPTGGAALASTLAADSLAPAGGGDLSQALAAAAPAADAGAIAAAGGGLQPTSAQPQAAAQPATGQPQPVVNDDGILAYFANWFDRVARAQSEQPSWPATLNTPPPYLVEQGRYDQYIEHLDNDASVRNFDVGKGLQLIPAETEEVDITLPPYLERDNRKPATGFGDWQIALFKQRLASAPAASGDYVASAWIAVTAPTGASAFTNHVFFVSPNVGGGKGWGNFDVQATFGASIPTSRSHLYGTSLLGNLAFQYRLERVIWPEVEFNWTDWVNGIQHGGKNQVLMTVGAVFGKFRIWNRLGVALGVGYQFPLAPSYRALPVVLPTYSRNWVASLRMPF